MPKEIDPKVKERCIQQMLDHATEYPDPTAAADVTGKRDEWVGRPCAAGI